MKGRWAAGIVPRNFAWIVRDRLAVSERPGGYAPHHRPVRRQEEILWIAAQGFTRVVSLLPSSHNLRAYEELNLPAAHFPLPANDDAREILGLLYPAILGWMRNGDRLLVHQEELGERVAGVMAGFLYWSGVFGEPPQAISAIEQLLKRQLGSAGRTIVAQSVDLAPPIDENGTPLPRRPIAFTASFLGAPSPKSAAGSPSTVKVNGIKSPTNVASIRPMTKVPKKRAVSEAAVMKSESPANEESKDSN